MMNRRILIQLTFGLLVGIFLVFLGTYIFSQPYIFQGSLIDPPAPAPDFTLSVPDGKSFSLSSNQGRIVLLYFGYTFCPDVCPTTLFDLKRLKDSLGEQKDDIIVGMITVDPERDNPELLSNYVSTFDPLFYGLSGTIQTLESIWGDYGVYMEKVPVEGKSGYLVDHTARVYVIDQMGMLLLTFPYGMSWEAMADDIRHLLGEPRNITY